MNLSNVFLFFSTNKYSPGFSRSSLWSPVCGEPRGCGHEDHYIGGTTPRGRPAPLINTKKDCTNKQTKKWQTYIRLHEFINRQKSIVTQRKLSCKKVWRFDDWIVCLYAILNAKKNKKNYCSVLAVYFDQRKGAIDLVSWSKIAFSIHFLQTLTFTPHFWGEIEKKIRWKWKKTWKKRLLPNTGQELNAGIAL